MDAGATANAILAALYARGAPRAASVRRSRWPLVRAVLLRAAGTPAPIALARAGLVEEAATLDDPGLLDWAWQAVAERRILTPVDPTYPALWLERLGAAAPPALSVRGVLPSSGFVAVIGSREVDADTARLAWDVARLAVAEGFAVVSGGASGVDQSALAGAAGCGDPSRAVAILATGLSVGPRPPGPCLSVCAPFDRFTPGQAMERNALIAAASHATVVVHARWREGGSWAAAVDALRRRLCPVLVWSGMGPAAGALTALGATPFGAVRELPELWLRPAPGNQPSLFGVPPIREAIASYPG